MPSDLPPEITALLAPGETIVWQARPRPSTFMLRGVPNIAYGVTWSVLGAFWYHGSGGFGKYSVFDGWWKITPLLSLPFILAGFSFFLYPIRLGARARRTWYIVTNRRAFIAELRRDQPPHVRVFGPENIAALEVVKRWGNLDDIILSARARENPHLKPRLEDAFLGVEHGAQAVAAIQALPRPVGAC